MKFAAKGPKRVLVSIDKRRARPYSCRMLRPRIQFRLAALFALGLPLAACFDSSPGPEKVREADELTRAGQYDEAIALYREHMEERLALDNRPQWENPHFYLLLIGDVQLGRGEPEAALATYEEAERAQLDPPLISDRYRAVGRWYEEHGQYQKALDLLGKYRDRDPLLFDVMLDRIAKELTAQEDTQAHQGKR